MLASSVTTCCAAGRIGDAVVAEPQPVVGVLWSAVATIELVRQTLRRPAQALEGLRAGDFVHQVAVDVEHGAVPSCLGAGTTCSSQILSYSVRCGHGHILVANSATGNREF